MKHERMRQNKPSAHRQAGFFLSLKLLTGIFIGVMLWGGFNWSLEVTNTESYCLSCHEMEGNAFNELQETVHYSNRTGVRASCPDCHVPKEWSHKVVQKITSAIRELPAHWSGKIDTPEKYEEHRLDMAKHEWKRMSANGSRECKNCHDSKSMDYTKQEPRSSSRHEEAEAEGKTCIDCHKGIAHHLPAGWKEATDKDKNKDSK